LTSFSGLNLVGFVWTVDQETHNTVTVEFYDREYHRDFHFTDPYLYDKACLSKPRRPFLTFHCHKLIRSSSVVTADQGTLFSSPPSADSPAHLFYRPHETWTTRSDWRTPLPPSESITAISLTTSYAIAATSANYIRIFTPYGTPLRVYRQKSSPTVTIASWRDYLFTLGNGALDAHSGKARLTYTIENLKRDEVCQAEDIVALPPPPSDTFDDTGIKTAFFSSEGDPCVYDTTGVLLVLLHWRSPNQARWVPLLDTKRLSRLASGRKEESYWPVAVAGGKFHCIILKGGDTSPYFPRPLLSEFAFEIPIAPSSGKHNEDGVEEELPEVQRLEQNHALQSLMLALSEDSLAATRASPSQLAALARQSIQVDKLLLQLLAVECREGEERGMKALDLVRRMKDETGKMVEAAGKVAGRYGRTALDGKIREVAEKRLLGEDEDEDRE
jgi:chromosome transmission fidelity protein 4